MCNVFDCFKVIFSNVNKKNDNTKQGTSVIIKSIIKKKRII